MTPDTWSQVRELLETALELPEEQRSAYLDSHCSIALRPEVESLLAAADTIGTFLDEPQFFPEMFTPAGTRIGPYTIGEPAGFGGMGVVYRAHDERLGRSVAVKLIPLALQQADLLYEARAASSLSHSNIVTIHDVLEYRGATAMVMEFVEGCTLGDLLAEGPLAPALAVSYARQIASALAASHQAGVLHRDLKPSNVMVRPDGVVKVLDFGIAQLLADGRAPAAGTRGYMPPEQAAGGPIDARSDIYAFGALFREMLPGKPSARWRRVLERCLAEAPGGRYGSMGEVVTELGRTDHRLRAAAIAAVLLSAVALVWHLRAPSVGNPEGYRVDRLASFDDLVLFPTISPDGGRVAYSMGGRLHIQGAGDAAGRDLSQEGRHPAFSPDGRLLAFRSEREGGGLFLLDLDRVTTRKLTSGGFHPAWSPDGRRLAFSTDAFEQVGERPTALSQLSIVEVAGGRILPLTDPAVIRDAIQPSWSPDGRRLAFWSVDRGGRRRVLTMAASGGPPVELTDGKQVDWDPVWSPDGWLYWISNRAGSMSVWRARVVSATGLASQPAEPVPLPAADAGFLSFSRTGKLAYINSQAAVSVWKAALSGEGAPLRLTPRAKRVNHPSVSPDGQWITGSAQGTSENIVVFRSDGSGFRYLTTGPFRDRGPTWSPDGDTIAFGSNRSGEYQLWSIRKDGAALHALTTTPEGAFSAVWSPDGKGLAWFSRGFRPHAVRQLGEPEVPFADPGPGGFRPSSWSADGRSIAGIMRSRDGGRVGIAIYNLTGGDYRTLDARCDSLSWMPERKELLCASGTSFSLVPVSGGPARPLLQLPNPLAGDFSVSRDGRQVYFVMSEVQTELWLADRR